LLPKAGVRMAMDASVAGAQNGDDQQGTPRVLFELT
jgi:hypothetical protein